MIAMIRRVVLFCAAGLTVLLALILLGQAFQLAETAATFDPRLATPVLTVSLLIMAGAVFVPAWLLLRMPKPLVPPADETSPEYARHLTQLKARLASNPHLQGQPLASDEDLGHALTILDGHAQSAVKSAGTRAFFTTSISQNGALDALVVLGIQARLIWDISHVYNQRPSARELSLLYSNVLATAFLAGEIDDMDMAEAMQPALTAVLGSTAAGAVPGLQAASNLVVNSVMSGTANAFLTLRVGVIAKNYSRALVRVERRVVRRAAVLEAGTMLGSIVTAGAKSIAGTVLGASRAAAGGALTSTGRRVKQAGDAVKSRLLGDRSGDSDTPASAPSDL